MTDVGLFILAAGVACSLSAAIASGLAWRSPQSEHWDRSRRLAKAASALYAAALADLLFALVTGRVGLEYVHRHIDPGTPLPYRLSALWGGQEGSLLLWTAFAALAVTINAWAWTRAVRLGRSPALDAGHPLFATQLFGHTIVALLALATIWIDPFRSTDPRALLLDPDGRGLQPVLRTPFMIIHPPLQFAAYGVATLPFAAALAHVVTGRKEWAHVILPWCRIGFLLSWTGLAIGALWAYVVLTFGGFWVWDPVETGNLLAFLPWVPLVHAVLYYRKKGTFPLMGPLFAFATLPMAFLAAFITRSGLWVSVHAFTDPGRNFETDALRRALDLIEANEALQPLVALGIVSVLAPIIVLLWRRQKVAPHRWKPTTNVAALGVAGLAGVALIAPGNVLALVFDAGRVAWPADPAVGTGLLLMGGALALALPTLWGRGEERAVAKEPRLERWIQMGPLVYLGMVLVSLAFVVTLLVTLSTVNGYASTDYDLRLGLLAVPTGLVLGVALMNQTVGRVRTLWLAAAALAFGLVGAFLWPERWTLALLLPVLGFAFAGAFTKWFKVADPGPQASWRRRVQGGLLLAGGLISLIYWANPPTRPELLPVDSTYTAWWAVWGATTTIVTLLCAFAALRRGHLRLALLGAVALTLSAAFTFVTGLGVLLLLWIWVSRTDYAAASSWELRTTWFGLQREVRKGGVYLIHVALLIGVTGYATATALASGPHEVHVDAGEAATVEGYTFILQAPVTISHGQPARIDVPLDLGRGGDDLGRTRARLWLEFEAHYAESDTIERLVLEDVYVRPVRIYVSSPAENWSFAPHENDVHLGPGDAIAGLDLEVRTFPAMHLVWGGAAGLTLGMVLVLVGGGLRFEAKASKD